MGRPKLPPKICSVEGCEKTAIARGWCSMHWTRWSKTGDPGPAASQRPPQGDVCSVDGCERATHARNVCHDHYREQRRRGAGAQAMPRRTPECQVPHCGAKHYALGYCSTHYYRLVNTGDLRADEPRRVQVRGRVGCLIPGCTRRHASNGLCAAHYTATRTYNISVERLVEMLSEACAICSGTDKLSIDHDHACCPGRTSCGKCIRGTLCMRHNSMLGQLKDDPALLVSAAEYLEAWAARDVS